MQQLLTESIVLGTIGGVVGVVLAYWMTRGLAVAGPATIPRVEEVRLDVSALIVAGLAAVAMSIAFGLLPALRIARARGNSLAQRTGNTADGGRVREVFMIAEFALAFVVLVGAGLVFVSSRTLETTPVGYDAEASLTFRVSLPLTNYSRPEQRAAFFETLLDRLRSLPGVTQSLRATIIGGTIGILGSIAVGRFLASVLYGGVAAQPLVMIGTAILLAGLSVLAAAGPARQASRVDPLIALRSE